jgi:hypothetical protein
MCAALAYPPINEVEDWLTVMENIPQSEKLIFFRGYYVQPLMENRNVPIEFWNIKKLLAKD